MCVCDLMEADVINLDPPHENVQYGSLLFVVDVMSIYCGCLQVKTMQAVQSRAS